MLQAVIMAGGKGTRLRSVSGDDIPKPMVLVNGKPILQHQLENIKQEGITNFTFVVGYKKEKIQEYFKDGSDFGVSIQYIEEETPLGTAGALYFLKDKIEEDFLLVYGDVIFDIDIERMLAFHKKKNAIATLFAHPNSHPYDSDLLVLNDDAKVVEFDFSNKEEPRNYVYKNCVNAGFYILHPTALKSIEKPEKLDLEKTVLANLIKQNKAVYGYISTEYIKDVGRPERLQKTEEDLMNGIVASRNLRNKQKCVFLDRDGTINVHKGLITKPEQIELIPGAAKAITQINNAGYLCIVITNQPVVARGLCSIEEVKTINNKLETLLGQEGAYVDDLLFCPHHPDKGYPEENPAYKINCNCRKPKIGLIEECVKRFNINLADSWFIGDTTIDIQTGVNAGLHTCLVQTGEAGNDKKYDVAPQLVKKDIEQAIEDIL